MTNLSDSIVLLTGAANGIGRALVKAYAAKGAFVYFVDIDKTKGIELEEEMKGQGYKSVFIEGDVGMEEDVLGILDRIKKEQNKLDILINNAGISTFLPLEETTFSQWKKVIHTNLSSVFLFSKHSSTFMIEGGAIINIASTRAIMSEPHSEAYAASKGGIVAITHALAASLAPKKIRVNAISPGWIETGDYEQLRPIDHEQHLSRRVGRPEDVVKACLFLSNEENDFINGENLVVDGGMTRKMIYEH